VNTGDDWQKSQWSPPRLAQGTRVIRQVSCSRRRVGEVGEDRSRLTVEQNVFCRALGATPFKGSSASQAVRHQSCVFSCEYDLTIVLAVAQRAEMLHTFPSMKNSGGRRPCLVQPDRTGCLHPLTSTVSNSELRLALSSNTPNSLPAIIPAWQEENLGVRSMCDSGRDSGLYGKTEAGPTRICRSILGLQRHFFMDWSTEQRSRA